MRTSSETVVVVGLSTRCHRTETYFWYHFTRKTNHWAVERLSSNKHDKVIM